MGTSKNRSYSSDATKLSANDSASFPFRFMDVHARAARDPHREAIFRGALLIKLKGLLASIIMKYAKLGSASEVAIASS